MNIALMAHDKKKELMLQFCTAYRSILAKHTLCATASTGRIVADATGLPVSLLLSRSQGGHQQVDARIAYNEVDLIILFDDPNNTDPWDDQRVIRTMRLCDAYNVPIATNLASAEMMILGLERGDLDWREVARPQKKLNNH
ncbi:MAG: methylglyoxal synthase [Oscillospiraceae bacterium]|nr:methylglyoxal synthase [Oscillospiraceae bacterium]MBR2080892.1 methylglyoxal synthase [Oscillospiraceae bacterium]MBR2366056.1 methylglyoxal synthase [Oscillospiraceae bacterium]MBR2896511.1 methylglyoxal synthase [Oscillospiraceae bacterium]MBR3849182.1 methylglyoxal synthase [Oscillospiraceae bacterium]